MPHLPATETAVSAPGKVLLTGGYLVLDRDYSGSVYALDARIHVIVQQLRKDKGGNLMISEKLGVEGMHQNKGSNGNGNGNGQKSNGDGDGDEDGDGDGDGDADMGNTHTQGGLREHETDEVIIVRSPQFLDGLWEYRVVRVSDGGGVKVVQRNEG